MPDVRTRVLAVLPGLFPSTMIGVAKPLLRLHQDHRIVLDLTLQYLISRRAVERADVLVLCHTIDPQYGVILDWARELGRPLIYEIDDDLLTVPDDIPGLAYLREPARREQLIACIRQADVVRVYSPALQKKLSQYNDHVSLVSGPLDWSLMPLGLPPAGGDVIKIVYATSRTEDRIGARLVTPLKRILEKFPNVQLTIWGPKHELAGHRQVRLLPLIRDYDTFFARFAREGFAIGLAPLPDDEFHRGKSNNKFREYSSCGIAGVYSDMSVYNTSVEQEVTGLLVPDDDAAWTTAIERLITDAALRTGIAERGRDYARRHFNETVTDGTWLTPIQSLAARPKPATVPTGQSGAPPAETLRGLARFAGRLGGKVGPVWREHGLATVAKRTWAHVMNLGQLLSWEVYRWRLRHRISAQRGRS